MYRFQFYSAQKMRKTYFYFPGRARVKLDDVREMGDVASNDAVI